MQDNVQMNNSNILRIYLVFGLSDSDDIIFWEKKISMTRKKRKSLYWLLLIL